jgi:hypothetical protein
MGRQRLKKTFFKGNYSVDPHSTVIFRCIILIFISKKDLDFSFQEQKQNESMSSG